MDVSKLESLETASRSSEYELHAENQSLILDFDHTLFLSNSTEEYLDCAQPKILVALLLAFIEGLKPWRLFPQENSKFIYRDAIRVGLITLIFPWTFFFWRLKVSKLARQYSNTELMELAIAQNWKIKVIASNGFKFILMPLLNAMGFQYDILIASELGRLKQGVRSRGKLEILQKDFADLVDLGRACFVTDNDDDTDLLGAVGNPVQKVWAKARHFRACQNVYIPFVYTEGSERGNKNHVVNTILLTNYLILLMTYGLSSTLDIFNAIALLCLSISLWCIYEAGYYENDFYEINHEETKGAGKKILKFIDYPVESGAWIWGTIIAFIGIVALSSKGGPSLDQWRIYGLGIGIWVVWLLIVRLTFRVYNFSKRPTRVLLYPILQIFRLAGPAIFFPVNFIGICLIVAQATSRWVWYLVYRTGGDRKAVPHHVVRLFIFLSAIVLYLLPERNLAPALTLQFATIFTWSLARSIPQLLLPFKKISSTAQAEAAKTI